MLEFPCTIYTILNNFYQLEFYINEMQHTKKKHQNFKQTDKYSTTAISCHLSLSYIYIYYHY